MTSMSRYLGKYINYQRLFAVLCVGLCVPVTSAYAPRVGQVHPDFTLPRLGEGQPVSLAQFRGRKVLLVHFASW